MIKYTVTYSKIYKSEDEFPCNSSGILTYHNNWDEFNYLHELMIHINKMKEFFFNLDSTGCSGIMSCYDLEEINNYYDEDEEKNQYVQMLIIIHLEHKRFSKKFDEELFQEQICHALSERQDISEKIINQVLILEFVIEMINNLIKGKWEN